MIIDIYIGKNEKENMEIAMKYGHYEIKSCIPKNQKAFFLEQIADHLSKNIGERVKEIEISDITNHNNKYKPLTPEEKLELKRLYKEYVGYSV